MRALSFTAFYLHRTVSLRLYLDEGGLVLWRRYDRSNDDLVVEFTHVRVRFEKLLFRLQIMSLKNVQITAERGGRAVCYGHSPHFHMELLVSKYRKLDCAMP